MINIKFIKFCPNCGSTDITIDFSNHVTWAYGTNVNNICKNCNFSNTFFPEAEPSKVKNGFVTNLEPLNLDQENSVDIKPGYFAGRLEVFIFLCFIDIIFFLVGFSLLTSFIGYVWLSFAVAGLLILKGYYKQISKKKTN